MAIGMAYVEYLSEQGLLGGSRSRVLDIGSQNLLNATPEAIRGFVERHHPGAGGAKLTAEIERLAYFSTPRPGERTTYLSELFDLTPALSYTSYDVCPALSTVIFDLNREEVPPALRGAFDLVLNFGTTEHVFNQANSFAVMHDALAVGGVACHQLPSIGFMGHGYFTYHHTFFEDLAKANDYDLMDTWYSVAGHSSLDAQSIDLRDAGKPGEPGSGVAPGGSVTANWYVLTALVRKTSDAPFHMGLELATSHSRLAARVAIAYGGWTGSAPVNALLRGAAKGREALAQGWRTLDPRRRNGG